MNKENKLPLEYKLLEWRLMINKELYDEKAIDIIMFSKMEDRLLNRMKKIQNNIDNITN